MGFLDHSTNNIIVDAVLTDTGRRLLSRNDGSFQIVKFGFGDDEVDYTIIKNFGVTVGKEKIEKNTPIFEAFTRHSIGIKHKLISMSDPNLNILPQYELQNITGNNVIKLNRSSLGAGANKQVITLELKTSNNVSIPEDASDFVVEVAIDRNFLRLEEMNPDYVRENLAFYRLSTTGETSSRRLSFTLRSIENIDDEKFATYSLFDGSVIETFVKVTGLNTGISKILTVQITK